MLQGLGVHVRLLVSLASSSVSEVWSDSGQCRGEVVKCGLEGCACVANRDADELHRAPVEAECVNKRGVLGLPVGSI